MARAASASGLAKAYLMAKDFVIRSGFQNEIDWQDGLSFETVSETDFLREMAWVVLSAGFREAVLRKRFHLISKSFLNWSSAREISHAAQTCRTQAMKVFNHRQKIDAILHNVRLVCQAGFPEIKSRIEHQGVQFLQELTFVGSITAFHLAKNLGLSVVKPDRHLVRTAKATGYACPTSMCEAIASVVAERISVVDVVIWRYATLDPDYETWFSKVARQLNPCPDEKHANRPCGS